MSLELQPLDDRVELRGLLGAGGMGEVHRAWDARLERAVAVKLLRGRGAEDAERLLLEARLQARVEHPHVVKVHEVGTLGGRPCVVLQLVEGRTLAAVARELPVADRVQLVCQAAAGLHAAHQQGLVHRDVKPDNVLVEEPAGGGRSALMSDFGLARAEEGGLSRSGFAPGTLDYMSPEQIVGPGPADLRSDIYALGASLYAVLAGRPPFRAPSPGTALAEEELRVMRRILEDEPPPLARSIPGVSRDLARVVRRAMEKEPQARYPSAEAFGDDLARFLRGEPVEAVPVGFLERAARWTRRNRALSRAVAVAALALVLAGGWALLSSRRAGLAALDAARLGAVAESMESALRQEHLAPPHDLRPALARVRAQVDRLRPAAARGDGPASFALGKGLELLDDAEGARAAYQRAWDVGFRSPLAAEGLGNVLGLLYRKEFQRARDTLEPEARAARVVALKAELRDPAALYLAMADAEGWRVAYLRAALAMLDEDFAAARARAAEVLAADPTRYEARVLEAEAWLDEGHALSNEQRFDEARPALAHAEEALDEAERFGRSDPRIPRARAWIHLIRATMLFQRGQPPDEEVKKIMATADQAAVLEPDSAQVATLRGMAILQSVQYAFSARPADVLGLLDQALAVYRWAIELDGGEVRTLTTLGRILYYRAYQLEESGRDGAVEAAREGLAAVDRAAARAPRDPDVPFVRCMLHHVEAMALFRAGRPRAAALRQAIEAGEEVIRLKLARAIILKPLVGQALVSLAAEDLRSGGDPHPDLQRGLDLLDTTYEALSGQTAIAAQLGSGRYDAADLAATAGEDPRPHIERALVVLDEALERHPGLAAIQAIRAEVLALEAWRRARAGEDPMSAVAESVRLLDESAAAMEGDVASQDARGRLALVEAYWWASHGRDPGPALERAEGVFGALARAHPEVVYGHDGLARCALERASWLAGRGGSPADVAQEGLAHLGRALDRDPRDPRLALVRARLEELAGDSVEARRSLEQAWAVNPLVRASWESRQAEAALGAGNPNLVAAPR
ncbi:MAG TPA: serine/threonine-protein kinase [Anaeromyxobacter sp.]|nr:serine/threonine-protein kinase [Anaeromyxobacter sp.]